jgi:hypothetical protein
VNIKSLKLTKETVQNLSDSDAGGIKGGDYVDPFAPKPNPDSCCPPPIKIRIPTIR